MLLACAHTIYHLPLTSYQVSAQLRLLGAPPLRTLGQRVPYLVRLEREIEASGAKPHKESNREKRS